MKNSTPKIIRTPLNRVEGDLEVTVHIEDNRISEAWSVGVMFRGIEEMLKNRGALDGLVITPRICGICSTAHLTAAAKALDAVSGAKVPSNAVIARNLALMAEHVQSDMRHGFLMYATDFTNPAYRQLALYDEAVRRYEPFKGRTVIDVIKHTKEILEMVAIFGGQWPHSSYMVPGGIASNPNMNDIMQCKYLIDKFASWYEKRILGCSLDRWQEVQSVTDLDAWLDEKESHRNSELGFYIQYAREIELDHIGKGHGNYISFGQLDLPENSRVRSRAKNSPLLIPAGFVQTTKIEPFDQKNIAEHVEYSWYKDDGGIKHPFDGKTHPYATGEESKKYSWTKAPRYNGMPAETGPLAEMIISGHPLLTDIANTLGESAYARELARLVRPAEFIPAMKQWIMELDPNEKFYAHCQKFADGQGFGLTQASRGALGHWVRISDNKIERYQVITPTAWNGSPRDTNGIRGPWEEALINTPVKNSDNTVEIGHVIRSFDPCLVCAVHTIHGKKEYAWKI
ncbi:MAG: nickel-dependent hydrogenase large subunit [Desulfobacterales bacterium]